MLPTYYYSSYICVNLKGVSKPIGCAKFSCKIGCVEADFATEYSSQRHLELLSTLIPKIQRVSVSIRIFRCFRCNFRPSVSTSAESRLSEGGYQRLSSRGRPPFFFSCFSFFVLCFLFFLQATNNHARVAALQYSWKKKN